jgi:2,5-dichloro-2,5-cyclohexadiene-1,4-diol dehydrogenase 1
MTPRDLQDKSIIVTGGASGIGRATAELAARQGARVTISDLSEPAGHQVVEQIRSAGGTAQFQRADVSNEADVIALVAAAVRQYGRLDGAFNNAGRPNIGKLLHELSLEEFEKVQAVNVRGVFLCMKYQIPEMLKGGGGAIVNTASAASLIAFPLAADYVASKHAVLGLTRAAALDYAAQNIRVNAVQPGTIRTPMLDGLFAASPESEQFLVARTPMGRLGKPEEIAEGVVWLLSDKASYVTATGLSIDGAYTAT